MKDYIVSKKFYERTMSIYPILKENEAYRRMFIYLVFPQYDRDTKKILIPAQLLAQIEGIEYNSDYIAAEFLESFKQDVLPNFTWNRWSVTAGKARTVENIGWNRLYEVSIQQERLNSFSDEERVWFMTGKKVIARDVKVVRNERKREAMNTLLAHSNKDAALMITYLNNNAPNAVTKTLKQNIDAAKLEAAKGVMSYDDTARKQEIAVFNRTMSILHSLETFPNDHYTISDTGTARLFTINAGMQQLPKRVRKALTKGWVEADLAAAHIAINAHIWHVVNVNDFIAAGNNVWKTILDDLALPFFCKPVIKDAFYTILYGGKRSTMKSNVTKGINKLRTVYDIVQNTQDISDAFSKHWIVQEMVTGRDVYLAAMNKANGAKGYYGEWYSLDEHDFKTILSHVACSYELALIKPIFDVALQHRDDFVITIYQFDGVSLHFKDKTKQDTILRKIDNAVKEQANTLGIHTHIEFEIN